MDKKQAILGVGNALVDVITLVKDDEIINQFNLKKGGMTLVNNQVSSEIYNKIKDLDKEIITGGSAANTINTLSSLGGETGYLGKIGNDELGAVFAQEMNDKKIANHLIVTEETTGRVISLVTANAERTMATYLGAAANLQIDEINESIFKSFSYLYIEGYLVQNHRLIEYIIDQARKQGLKVAIDLSSYNIVEENLDFLKQLIKDKVDIVFANEEEAQSFTGVNPREALDQLAEMCELAIVKIGKHGSYIKNGNNVVEIGSIKANAIDTTGAGDNYAAGFLYGLTKGYSLQKCGKIAALVAANVVENKGAKLPQESLSAIKQAIERL
ncbi:MAG: adenosine kinase [Draconibacterium sp.]|nr:MAG: adenosine kinase [Draconibacterium sp.]